MTRRELGVWALLWALIASAVTVAIIAGFLLLSVLDPSVVAADQPVTPAAVPAAAFVAVPSPALPRSASSVPSATPVRIPAATERAVAETGISSWFASPAGVSAAGPELRAALGAGWRGSVIRVSGPAGTATVMLGDWCSCYPGTTTERLVDLDAASFRAVCGPLALGLCRVTVTP